METDRIVHFDDEPRIFNTLDTDFKAEVIASGLKEQGYDPQRTLIIRQGDGRRGFSKDIQSIRAEYSQHDMTDYLHINTNRKSIYDELPEALFHQNLYNKDKNSKEEVLDEIRIHREEEFFARRFFKPFEIVADQVSVSFQHKERRLDKMNIHRDFIETFSQRWPILKLLSLRQAVMCMRMLPFVEHITTSLEKISRSMSILLELPIAVRKSAKTILAEETTLVPLGECTLNDTFIIGSMLEDGTFGLQVEIGPIPFRRIEMFLDTGKESRILEALMDMLLPADKIIEKRYIVDPGNMFFRLSGQDNYSYLGINSYLT